MKSKNRTLVGLLQTVFVTKFPKGFDMQSTIIHPADWTVELNTSLRANELLPNNLMAQLQNAGFDVNKSWAVAVGAVELFTRAGEGGSASIAFALVS